MSSWEWLLYCTVLYCTFVPYCTVPYYTVLYHTVTSLADTHVLIKLFMLGPLDKNFMVEVGGSRSRSDFEIELYIEIDDRTWDLLLT